MQIRITTQQLIDIGLAKEEAHRLSEQLSTLSKKNHTPETTWQEISALLSSSTLPFSVHLLLFSSLFPHWQTHPETAAAWMPTNEIKQTANVARLMSELRMNDTAQFHQWTVQHYPDFWEKMIQTLKIKFDQPPSTICDLSQGVAYPIWLPNAKMNIVNSCFTAANDQTAIIYQDSDKNLKTISYGELNALSNQIANSLLHQGYAAGDAFGIAMPMHPNAVAIYLGIIKMGGVVVSIADSFSAEEITLRLQIAAAKAIFTQDLTLWGSKKIPLYDRVKESLHSVSAIVLPLESKLASSLRHNDLTWDNFLVNNKTLTPYSCDPMTACNILFSSGTTGTPKAIVWNHTTPIKAGSDAYLHQNIQANDVLAWPTNLGWMMGPWLIFAALINRATIALYTGAPKDRDFGEFIQHAKVTMLGVVPTLVATWRQSQCMEHLNWKHIKVFSSTGECSNPEDMFYLMSLAGYKPIIEYCGGTEIGGAYVSSTVLSNNYPSLFSTPTMGNDFAIINEAGEPSDIGEVAIIPPSIGLSTQLLNADHHQTYFANMPTNPDGRILRRHGDQIKQYDTGYYSILGRVDDTMNLGGIKTSAAEIERILAGLPNITEVAAIAIPPPTKGPSLLVIFASTQAALDKQTLTNLMQKKINTQLNPLFKIYDVVLTPELPKTASNKIMRRVLRKEYISAHTKE